MSDIQYFLTDCGIEVNVDPIFHKKFNDCYGAEFNVDELIFMLEKLGVDVKKLQAENAELKEQTNKKIRKVLCDIGTELENDTRINKKSMPFVRAVVINKIYDYPTPPEGG